MRRRSRRSSLARTPPTCPIGSGVVDRSLYRFHELYVHVINFDRPVAEAMTLAQQLPAFQSVSDQLRPFISPYAPDWRSPRDAMADRFYTWISDVGSLPVDRLRS